MISKKMLDLGTKRSVIRDIFEYGSKLAKEIGAENVLDFSLGNPSTPAPREVGNTIKYMVEGLSPKDYNSTCSLFLSVILRYKFFKYIYRFFYFFRFNTE